MIVMRADHIRPLLRPCVHTQHVRSQFRPERKRKRCLTASTGLVAVAPLAPRPDTVDRAGGLERASDFLSVAVLRNALCAAVCLTKTCTSSQKQSMAVLWAWLRTAATLTV